MCRAGASIGLCFPPGVVYSAPMLVDELDYELPDGAIAQYPTPERDGARLLVLEEPLRDAVVRDFPELVPEGALLVLNDTRVLRARVHATRQGTGGKVEILFLAPKAGGDPRVWEALVRANRPLPLGAPLEVGDVELRLGERTAFGTTWIEASTDIASVIERHGHVPLPPYVRREDEVSDQSRYQTVFAKHAGSVAAPTAGLHLTPAMLERAQARGVELGYVTLHVGAGTFRPVASATLAEHVMHEERYFVSEALVQQVAAARARRAPIVAVGTTAVRALESAALQAEQHGVPGILAGEQATRLLISPGYRFRVIDALLTNFHAPRSTLLALVYAFAGQEHVRAAYGHALSHGYRFLSYGDAMWIPQRCA